MRTIAVCELCAGTRESDPLQKGAILTCGRSVRRGIFRECLHLEVCVLCAGSWRLAEKDEVRLLSPRQDPYWLLKLGDR
jgi:hypothetical protein